MPCKFPLRAAILRTLREQGGSLTFAQVLALIPEDVPNREKMVSNVTHEMVKGGVLTRPSPRVYALPVGSEASGYKPHRPAKVVLDPMQGAAMTVPARVFETIRLGNPTTGTPIRAFFPLCVHLGSERVRRRYLRTSLLPRLVKDGFIETLPGNRYRAIPGRTREEVVAGSGVTQRTWNVDALAVFRVANRPLSVDDLAGSLAHGLPVSPVLWKTARDVLGDLQRLGCVHRVARGYYAIPGSAADKTPAPVVAHKPRTAPVGDLTAKILSLLQTAPHPLGAREMAGALHGVCPNYKNLEVLRIAITGNLTALVRDGKVLRENRAYRIPA